jgi:heme exporter protein B
VKAAVTIARRDLLIEWRQRQAVPAMSLMAVGVFVLLHFGLDRDRLDGELAAGVFWMAVLLGTVLGLTRLYAAEGGGRLDGLRLAPISRVSLYLAKAAALFCFLVLFEMVALAAFAVLLLGGAGWQGVALLVAVLLVADVALALSGALLSAIVASGGARELLVPLLALPLMVPVMIAAAGASAPLLADDVSTGGLGRWLGMLLAYGAVFGLTAAAVFEELVDE